MHTTPSHSVSLVASSATSEKSSSVCTSQKKKKVISVHGVEMEVDEDESESESVKVKKETTIGQEVGVIASERECECE